MLDKENIVNFLKTDIERAREHGDKALEAYLKAFLSNIEDGDFGINEPSENEVKYDH